jgi:hypothetical protein
LIGKICKPKTCSKKPKPEKNELISVSTEVATDTATRASQIAGQCETGASSKSKAEPVPEKQNTNQQPPLLN